MMSTELKSGNINTVVLYILKTENKNKCCIQNVFKTLVPCLFLKANSWLEKCFTTMKIFEYKHHDTVYAF